VGGGLDGNGMELRTTQMVLSFIFVYALKAHGDGFLPWFGLFGPFEKSLWEIWGLGRVG